MKHAETELFPGFITGWQRSHWCSSVSCQDLNRQELPVAPQWHCWMQCTRSASHVHILWKYADGVWDVLPGGGFPQSCILPFTPAQVGRLPHLARPCSHFASGMEDLKALQFRVMRSAAQKCKSLCGFATVSSSTYHVPGSFLPHHPPCSPATGTACQIGGSPWIYFSEFRYFDAHHHKAYDTGASECERLFFSFTEILQISSLVPRVPPTGWDFVESRSLDSW